MFSCFMLDIINFVIVWFMFVVFDDEFEYFENDGRFV